MTRRTPAKAKQLSEFETLCATEKVATQRALVGGFSRSCRSCSRAHGVALRSEWHTTLRDYIPPLVRGSPLSIALAQRIVLNFPGVSLDWLYLGRPEALSCQISEKLGYGATPFQPGTAEQKTSQEERRSPAIQIPQ